MWRFCGLPCGAMVHHILLKKHNYCALQLWQESGTLPLSKYQNILQGPAVIDLAYVIPSRHSNAFQYTALSSSKP